MFEFRIKVLSQFDDINKVRALSPTMNLSTSVASMRIH